MIEPIDPIRYLVFPRASGRHTVSAARMLVLYAPEPEQQSVDVVEALKKLMIQLPRTKQGYLDRRMEFGPSVLREDTEVDIWVDGILYIVRDRCNHYETFERPAVVEFAAKGQPSEFDYVAAIELARRARRVSGVLFVHGLDFTRLSFPVQAEHLLEMEKVIADNEVAADLDLLVGPVFMAALREGTKRYVAMVNRRTERNRGSSVNLRALHADLLAAIQTYVIALLAMQRSEDEANVAMIRKALRPIDALREQIQRERRAARGLVGEELEEGEEGDVDVEGIEDLLQEQAAFDAELGLSGSDTAEDTAPDPS